MSKRSVSASTVLRSRAPTTSSSFPSIQPHLRPFPQVPIMRITVAFQPRSEREISVTFVRNLSVKRPIYSPVASVLSAPAKLHKARRWLEAGAVALLLAGCGSGAHKNARSCWDRTLTAWVVAQTPGGYADPLHDIPRAAYAGQVQIDAAYYEARRQPPGGINGLETAEFAQVQAQCGRLRVSVKS